MILDNVNAVLMLLELLISQYSIVIANKCYKTDYVVHSATVILVKNGGRSFFFQLK